MKWILIVLIMANNAENVVQIGPFSSEELCLEPKSKLEALNNWEIKNLGCFPLSEKEPHQ